MRQLGKEQIAAGKWLTFSKLRYEGHDGKERVWECVGRSNTNGAIGILATFRGSGDLVMIRQYRPPVDRFVIEFPAGLMDPGETPEDAALRELREETGYLGKIVAMYPRAYSSPGLTDEYVQLALVEVDPESRTDTDFDDSESIETFRVSRKDLLPFLRKAMENGDVIDAKVMAYACGLQNI